MAKRTGGAMHVVTTRRQYKGKTYHTHLLRRSVREGGKVRKETLANLSHLPDEAITAVRQVLAGEQLVAAGELFETTRRGRMATSRRWRRWPGGWGSRGCWGRRAASGTWPTR